MDPLEMLYDTRTEERGVFGEHFCGPERLDKGEDVLVARYEKTCEDGYEVEVYCYACPARFYKIVALPGENSCGEPQEGFTLTTGSSMAEWAAETAKHIANGLVAVDKEED